MIRPLMGVTTLCLILSAPLASAEPADPAAVTRQAFELRRFPAAEARQAVAADAGSIFAINNHAIGRYDKETGAPILGWEGAEGGPFIHLNSGIVLDGRLYSAHSNYPALPQQSSLEWFDPETLGHLGSVSFGQSVGSFVWADRHDGYWWLGFVHYAGRGSPPDRGPEWSQLVKADDEFRTLESFAFPPALIEAFHGYSASGGAWGPDGRLYVTGHDEPRLYALSLPVAGSELVWEETIAIPAEGQGFAWDPEEPWVIYTLERSRQEIVVSRIPH